MKIIGTPNVHKNTTNQSKKKGKHVNVHSSVDCFNSAIRKLDSEHVNQYPKLN